MEFFLFLFLILMALLLWKFIDNLFEMGKDQEKYSREEYQLAFYILDYVKEFWGRAFDFTGKTKRKNFWLTLLQGFILYFFIIGFPIGFYVFSEIYNSSNPVETANSLSRTISYISWFGLIINFIPSLSIQVRRLNDVGRDPCWVLLSFIPFISFILIFWYARPSFRKESNLVNEESNIWRKGRLIKNDYLEERLLKLRRIFEKGLISDEEYEELRRKTLGL